MPARAAETAAGGGSASMKKSKPEPIPVMDYRQYRRARRFSETCHSDMARRRVLTLLVTSVAPIPMATMVSKEGGNMGQNYLRSLFALAFQAFLIIVCVAIYAALVQNIAVETDISAAIWTCMGYTVLLCFTLFKTGSMAKSIFSAH